MKRDHSIMTEHAESLAAAALRMAEQGHNDSVQAARSASAICYRVAREMRQRSRKLTTARS